MWVGTMRRVTSLMESQQVTKPLDFLILAEKVPVFDYSEEGTRESFRQSSERMKGIKISCLRLHDAETEEFFAEATKEGCAVDTLIQMRFILPVIGLTRQKGGPNQAHQLRNE